jgi:mannose-1-phosphate guanylyltransferase/mannose-6-phosphate isomerase
MTSILPVILSGGSGTRLWPLSTPDKPKQFHSLFGARSMLQTTLDRCSGADFATPLVIGNARHHGLITAHAPNAHIVLEPVGRNTALTAAVAALWAHHNAPDTAVLLTPADHVITDADGFRRAVRAVVDIARRHIVTFGMTPDYAATGFGYIRQGDGLSEGVFHVDAFVEKPDAGRAADFLAQGGYSWNGGIFAFAADVMLAELASFAPDVLRAAEQALGTRNGAILGAAAVEKCPNISLDYAVMEHTRRAAVYPLSVGWADVGSFDEIWRLSDRDATGVATRGTVVADDCRDCLFIADGTPLAVAGLTDQIVISSPAGTLSIKRGESQRVKDLSARL